jgi:hypothetical protein
MFKFVVAHVVITSGLEVRVSVRKPPTCHASVVVTEEDVGVHVVVCLDTSFLLYVPH